MACGGRNGKLKALDAPFTEILVGSFCSSKRHNLVSGAVENENGSLWFGSSEESVITYKRCGFSQKPSRYWPICSEKVLKAVFQSGGFDTEEF